MYRDNIISWFLLQAYAMFFGFRRPLTMQHFKLVSIDLNLSLAPSIAFWLMISVPLFSNSVGAFEGSCPLLRHGYGPFDYRSATKEQLVTVEGAHFFPNVENLRKDTFHPNRGYVVIPGAEIDYTLRAFPNHHRALMAASRLSLTEHSDRPTGLKTSVDCYFKSALEFIPDDSYVFMIYGVHLAKKGKSKEALEYLDKANSMGNDSANLNYNLGLVYFQLKRYDDALQSAHKAYAAGFPLVGLRNMLMRAGKWKDIVQDNVILKDKSQLEEVTKIKNTEPPHSGTQHSK
jgi:hypothetical protein